MKKLTAMVVAASLLLMPGCGSNDPEPTSPDVPSTVPIQATAYVPQSPEIPEIPEPEASATKDISLITLYDHTIAWRDPYDQYHTLTLRLPALTGTSEGAQAYNRKVRQLGQLLLDEVMPSFDKGYFPSSFSLSYESYTEGDVLYIILERKMTEAYSMYYVDAFDLANHSALTKGQIIRNLTGMDYPTFLYTVTELSMQEFIRTYSYDVQKLEEDMYPGSDAYFETEPDPFVQEYYKILERFPFMTMYLSQAMVMPDQNGETGLYICTPDSEKIDQLRYVIPYNISELTLPSQDKAYTAMLDLMFQVDGAHTTAYGLMVKDAFFADARTFIHYAANDSRVDVHNMVALLQHALYEDEVAAFHGICQALMREELSEKELAMVVALSAIS